MHISDEGLVAGSVNRSQLAAAYANATDETVKANLEAAGVENGMYVEDGKLVDPSEPVLEPAPTEEAEPESGRPKVADNKEAWVDWALSQSPDLTREDAEALTKADLIDLYSDKE
jgi:hypothetical protein